ncbi:hypothetical protein F5050DRAFT_1713019 [Lentinula boryana]|uniref:Uncharacterized protein n=1 Tax=Lentinula boryana TaxID=40481 RepID=A0ABQ8Q9R3_9AGAR|nr:hypothetical protein F5050DRAFT_1713019 [Lentinula boryana]
MANGCVHKKSFQSKALSHSRGHCPDRAVKSFVKNYPFIVMSSIPTSVIITFGRILLQYGAFSRAEREHESICNANISRPPGQREPTKYRFRAIDGVTPFRQESCSVYKERYDPQRNTAVALSAEEFLLANNGGVLFLSPGHLGALSWGQIGGTWRLQSGCILGSHTTQAFCSQMKYTSSDKMRLKKIAFLRGKAMIVWAGSVVLACVVSIVTMSHATYGSAETNVLTCLEGTNRPTAACRGTLCARQIITSDGRVRVEIDTRLSNFDANSLLSIVGVWTARLSWV